MFIDSHKHRNLIERRNKFSNLMKNLDLCLMKFKKNASIKVQVYLQDCLAKKKIYWSIIFVTHDDCIFCLMMKKDLKDKRLVRSSLSLQKKIKES